MTKFESPAWSDWKYYLRTTSFLVTQTVLTVLCKLSKKPMSVTTPYTLIVLVWLSVFSWGTISYAHSIVALRIWHFIVTLLGTSSSHVQSLLNISSFFSKKSGLTKHMKSLHWGGETKRERVKPFYF